MKHQKALLRFALFAFCFLVVGFRRAEAAERPNFVWILSEDNSKHYLKLFDERGAPAPNIEKMATEGVVFDHAFSCSPVCSVARTTLITTAFAPKIGTQFHRKMKVASLPEGLRMFPAYLRDAGYYTTNNAKKDYNAVEENGAVWDESSRKASWRNRPSPETPFFHMQTFTNSHESSLHFSTAQMEKEKLGTNPAQMQVAPYHPDTPTFRYTYARYHDRIKQIDAAVGDMLKRLSDDGLLEDTFVFYFGDHGGVLPRSKGYLYESGLHVPLVVRIPKKWQQAACFPRGSRTGGFVSFVDFGPTVLHLAGLPVAALSDGRPFLGEGVSAEEVNSRDEVFGYADRFDEKYELVRSLRKGRFKYIRNYQAFYPDALQNNYRYRILAYQQWRELYQQGKLNSAQRQFFERKSPEALYDIESDPHEIHNLAGQSEYADILADLRRRLSDRVKSLPDLSMFPESVLIERAMDDPVQFGRSHAEEIVELVDTADLSLLPFEDAKPKIEAALSSSNAWVRYWALTVCSIFDRKAEALVPNARSLLTEQEPLVRVRAAEFLGILGVEDPRPTILDVLKTCPDPATALITLNTVVFLRDGPPAVDFQIRATDVLARGNEVSRRLEYLNQ